LVGLNISSNLYTMLKFIIKYQNKITECEKEEEKKEEEKKQEEKKKKSKEKEKVQKKGWCGNAILSICHFTFKSKNLIDIKNNK
jgi:hypothetical protein